MSISLTIFLMIAIMYATKNPIVSTLSLILMTLSISLLTIYIKLASWLPYVLILTSAGGLLVLFIYMASLSPNHPSSNKISPYVPVLYFSSEFLAQGTPPPYPPTSLLQMNSMMHASSMFVFSAMYLLMAVVMASSIISTMWGPLRSS